MPLSNRGPNVSGCVTTSVRLAMIDRLGSDLHALESFETNQFDLLEFCAPVVSALASDLGGRQIGPLDLCPDSGYPDFFRELPQYLQTNEGIISYILHSDSFLSHSLQIFIH
jgi:hypothetical protein